ncbi:MAG: hypothetical protein HOC74_34055 [Gemmatimonadetes bacterium]|nr:hypothetical protein [Gemmatimonadota bacterium]
MVRKEALLPPAASREGGHPKLVALLVGEDYRRTPDGPDWGSLGALPGVWQDLARVHRRLSQVGFGKIVVLAGDKVQGNQASISLEAVAGVAEEPEGEIALPFDGPATRTAMVEAAGELRKHLEAHRTADDGRGGESINAFIVRSDVRAYSTRSMITRFQSGEKGP